MQLWEIDPINTFQRRVKQCVVGVHCGVSQILPICNRRHGDSIGVITQCLGHSFVKGCVAERDGDGRGEESVRTVRRIRRVRTVREDAVGERFESSRDSDIWVETTKFSSPELQARGVIESYLNSCSAINLTIV
jgi:hypothetical protein